MNRKSVYRQYQARIKSLNLQIVEAGSDLHRREYVVQAKDWIERSLAEVREKGEVAKSRLLLEIEGFKKLCHRTEVIPRFFLRYRDLGKWHLYVILPGISLDFLISGLLSQTLFWWLPVWAAVLLGCGLAAILALFAHGLFATMFDNARPLRKLRLLHRILVISMLCVAALVIPVITARVIDIAPFVTSLSMAIMGLLLPITVGTASAIRSTLITAIVTPMRVQQDCQQTERLLNDQLALWEQAFQQLREPDVANSESTRMTG